MLIAPYDGSGGARRALELLGLRPALVISIERDKECKQVIDIKWPGCVHFPEVHTVSQDQWKQALEKYPDLTHGIIVGGPPCQGFSGANSRREHFDDERSDEIDHYVAMVQTLKALKPDIVWHDCMENVSSMDESDKNTITQKVSVIRTSGSEPYEFDAAQIGPQNRPRSYWTSWEFPEVGQFVVKANRNGNRVILKRSPAIAAKDYPSMTYF